MIGCICPLSVVERRLVSGLILLPYLRTSLIYTAVTYVSQMPLYIYTNTHPPARGSLMYIRLIILSHATSLGPPKEKL